MENKIDSATTGGQLSLDLKEHGVIFTLPVGSLISGNIKLPGGALILGSLSGTIVCDSGSLIFAPGSNFSGHAKSDCMYVGGNVAHPKQGNSTLTANNLMAISTDAVVHADIAARMFSLNSRHIFGSIKTLSPLANA